MTNHPFAEKLYTIERFYEDLLLTKVEKYLQWLRNEKMLYLCHASVIEL